MPSNESSKPGYCVRVLNLASIVAAQMLDTLLGREFLAESRPAPYPTAGLGYQVVVQSTDAGLLKGIE